MGMSQTIALIVELGWMKGEKMMRQLIQKIKHQRFCKLNNYYCPDCIYHHFVWDGVVFRGNACLYGKQEALPFSPTDDVAERKQGEWIDYEDAKNSVYGHVTCLCSVCGHVSQYKENYCMHCGADMRGSEE